MKSYGTFCKKFVVVHDRPHPPGIRPPVKAVLLASPIVFETPQAEAGRPRTSVTWIRLPFWRSSSETEAKTSSVLCAVNLPAISSSRTSFGVKTRERSKYQFAEITWHRRSIARSFVGNKLSNFGRKCPKKCLPRFINGALKLRLCHFVNEGPGILK